MKEKTYTELICRRFCSFYKEGKEELTCETYNFLVRNLTEKELGNLSFSIDRTPDLVCDDYIRDVICDRCEFLKDGCDFRDGKGSTPCGGYVVVENLSRWLYQT